MTRTARRVLVALLAGAVLGVVVAGLGSRLSMRLVTLYTEGPPFTLTGAEVGEVSLDGTLSLLGSAAQAGAIVGLFYAVIRWALPSSRRALTFASLALLLPGGVFLGDDEFQLFTPSLLTAAFFVPLFPLGGLALAALVERLDPEPARNWTGGRRLMLAAVALLGLAVFARSLFRLA